MNLRIPTLLVAALSAAALTHAALVRRPIAYEHEGVQLEGHLVYDDSVAGPRPGVLLVHEWWGLNDYVKSRAEDVAKLGYVAFALDMYGKGVVTDDPKHAGELAGKFYGSRLIATRAQAGLDALLATKLVDPAKVAALGFCFGGSTVQALAFNGAPVAGIVSFHGNPVMPWAGASNRAKFLILHGASDNFIPNEQMLAYQKALTDGKFDWQWISYADALHAFTNPGADAIRERTGLNVAYNEPAARRSWEHLRLFLRELFGS